jgi:hypothetical protein
MFDLFGVCITIFIPRENVSFTALALFFAVFYLFRYRCCRQVYLRSRFTFAATARGEKGKASVFFNEEDKDGKREREKERERERERKWESVYTAIRSYLLPVRIVALHRAEISLTK